jgi:hypothetical protein
MRMKEKNWKEDILRLLGVIRVLLLRGKLDKYDVGLCGYKRACYSEGHLVV